MIEVLTEAEVKRRAAVKKKNNEFNALPMSQQRIAIARDVLAQVAVGRLIPSGVNYFVGDYATFADADGDAQLDEVFSGITSCEVCALGSMFFCGVERANSLKVNDAGIRSGTLGSGATYRYLSKFFDHGQLEQIESAFERSNMSVRGEVSVDVQRSIAFGTYIDNYVGVDLDYRQRATLRLQFIMENLIANGGYFNPNVLPTPKAVIVWETKNLIS